MTKRTVDREAAREAFDDFLMRMDDQLEALQDDAETYGIRLDFNADNLHDLERYFDFAAADDAKTVDRDSLIVTCGRYLGEVVRLRYGGKWELTLDDPRSLNYNMPVIVGHSKYDVQFSPITVMRGYSLRKRPNMLAQAVASQIDYQGLGLENRIEGESPDSADPRN